MAGGNFTTENKVRAGAYINFKSVASPLMQVGARGVVAIPLSMDWGDKLTELYSTDLIDGSCLAKIGCSIADVAESLVYRQLLSHAYKAWIYRINVSPLKSTKTSDELKVTAKYGGVFGNKIKFSIIAVGSLWDVKTIVDGKERDSQRVSDIDDLVANDWVEFSKNATSSVLAAASGVELAGGTNGAVGGVSDYTDAFAALQNVKFDTLALPLVDDSADTTTIQAAAIALIKSLRDDQGKKCKVVLHDAVSADYEGVLSTWKGAGYSTKTEDIGPADFVAWVAGLDAGTSISLSRDFYVVPNAVAITGRTPSNLVPTNNNEIIDAIKKGYFLLSARDDGKIVVEADINTFTSFTQDKNSLFSRNRLVRTLDEFNNTIKQVFESSYVGKLSNNEIGRDMFKADLIAYARKLQDINALQNVVADDFVIRQGEKLDAVVVDCKLSPVDSMTKLYMECLVG